MKKLVLIIFILLSVNVINADILDPSLLGTNAGQIGIANVEGFSGDASTMFENPAGLYRINRISLASFKTTLMSEVHYNNVAIGVKTSIGTIGLGYISAKIYDIPHTGEDQFNEFYTINFFNYSKI